MSLREALVTVLVGREECAHRGGRLRRVGEGRVVQVSRLERKEIIKEVSQVVLKCEFHTNNFAEENDGGVTWR